MTYRVIWCWYCNGQEFTRRCEEHLDEATARTLCQQLNMLAQSYGQSDTYYMEQE